MRFSTLTLLLALGMAGINGCGGASSVTGSQPAPDDAYDTPPSTNDDPVTTQDATPATYDMPTTDYQSPSGDGSTGASGPLCPRLCKVLTELTCTTQDPGGQTVTLSDAECESECTAQITEITSTPCLEETLDLFSCLFDESGGGLTCELVTQGEGGTLGEDQLAQLGQQVLNNCGDENTAFQKCEAALPPMQGAPCMPGTCDRCTDDCSRCDCDGNMAACTACINN